MNPAPIQRLVTELSRLPGIGQRTAQRLAFHILRADDDAAFALADAIREVKEKVGLCEVCFNLAEGPRCRICEDERRERGLICVVEEPADVIPIERTGEYRGLYHVLGGALSPIDGIDPDDLKIAELSTRIDAGGVEEVVLATNPTTTGEATALYIADLIRERVSVTRLASGLPVGRSRARRRGDAGPGLRREALAQPLSSGHEDVSSEGQGPDRRRSRGPRAGGCRRGSR